MTFTNTQTTELSLDQLDDVSAGIFGAAAKAAKMSFKLAARHGVRAGFKPKHIREYYNFIKRPSPHTQKLVATFDPAPTTLQYIGLGTKLAGGAAAVATAVVGITHLFK